MYLNAKNTYAAILPRARATKYFQIMNIPVDHECDFIFGYRLYKFYIFHEIIHIL